MASKRPSKRPLTTLPAPARLLFAQLEREYAQASAQEWAELEEHLGQQLAVLAGGSAQRRELLVAEFAAVRDRVLSRGPAREVAAALAAGQGTCAGQVEDGLELWQVALGTQTVRLFVPVPDGSVAADVARAALLAGRCRLCHAGLVLAGGVAEVAHAGHCTARRARR